MIPKIIHYCWFGPKSLPERHWQFIEDAKKLMPDWKFILWGNRDLPKGRFTDECLKWRKYALLSDYMRLAILERDGGIYLDTDIEVYKSFDHLVNNACFLAFEKDGRHPKPLSNAFMGAVPGHPFISECLDILTWELNHRCKPWYGVKIANRLLKSKGVEIAEAGNLGDILLLDRRTAFEELCHHYLDGSWHTPHTFSAHLKNLAYKATRAKNIIIDRIQCRDGYP